ncbi:cyclic nucleotide-binding domain-containing protein [Acidobacteriota bacterium]
MVSLDELRKFHIFSRLTDKELENILPIIKKEKYETGKRVIEEKSEAPKLFLVLEGRASIKKRGGFGKREMVIDDALPGEIFGWSAIAAPHTYTAAVITTERSVFLTIDSNSLLNLFEQNKDIGYKVMAEIASVISSRFRKVIGQFVSYL